MSSSVIRYLLGSRTAERSFMELIQGSLLGFCSDLSVQHSADAVSEFARVHLAQNILAVLEFREFQVFFR